MIHKTVVCDDIEGNKYTVDVTELTFRPAVYGVIIQDDRVLLSKQWDGYDFPGGGIELGEDTFTALTREVKEETGLDVQVGEVLHTNNSFFKLPFVGDYVHSIHMYYYCEVVGGEITDEFFDTHEKEYASKAEWVALSTISDIRIYSSENPKKILEKFLKKL